MSLPSLLGATVLLLLAGFAADAEAQGRHILVLQSFDRGVVTLDSFTANFRADLEAKAGESILLRQFVVYPSGFGATPEPAIVDYLRAAFADRPKPDLVMTVGGPASVFARKHRRELFPDSPLLLAAVDERFLQTEPLATDEAAVAVRNDIPAIVEDILRLMPDTSNIFVAIGSGEIAKFWRGELEREFERFRGRINFTWSDRLSYKEVLTRVSTLPAHSAILYIAAGTDLQGNIYAEDRIFADLRAVSKAPLFGTQGTMMGYGIVGGRLMPIDELGRTATDVALKILNGTTPGQIATAVQRPGRPVFDWRELRRWGISETRLPANSDIRFRQQGVWERFWWAILAGGFALFAQTVLIGTLLVNRAKRRRAEESLRESEGRFRVLANSAPVMIRMSGVDAEFTDFNHTWLAFTGRPLEIEQQNGWLDGVHADDRSSCLEAYRRAIERRQSFRTEYRLRGFDGQYRWVLDSGEPRFTPGGAFAGYIASTIDITELKAARAALSSLNRRMMEGQERERRRLARELHDDIGQRMAMLMIELDQLRTSLPAGAATLDAFTTVNQTLATLATDIQAISHRLHSFKLDYLGIVVAARSLCRDVSTQRGVRIDYAHDNVPADLPDGVALNLFRVLQEALSNAVKHSGAKIYKVTLRGTAADVILEVTDDGRGFDVGSALRGQGLGLVSMNERIKLVHGDVTIQSSVGAGTTVLVRVPLTSPVEEPSETTTLV